MYRHYLLEQGVKDTSRHYIASTRYFQTLYRVYKTLLDTFLRPSRASGLRGEVRRGDEELVAALLEQRAPASASALVRAVERIPGVPGVADPARVKVRERALLPSQFKKQVQRQQLYHLGCTNSVY